MLGFMKNKLAETIGDAHKRFMTVSPTRSIFGARETGQRRTASPLPALKSGKRSTR